MLADTPNSDTLVARIRALIAEIKERIKDLEKQSGTIIQKGDLDTNDRALRQALIREKHELFDLLDLLQPLLAILNDASADFQAALDRVKAIRARTAKAAERVVGAPASVAAGATAAARSFEAIDKALDKIEEKLGS